MYNFDLRLVVPALINLTLFLLQHHRAGNPTLNMDLNSWWFSCIVVLTLILTTSVKLTLSVTAERRIRVRAGDFSFIVAVLLLGSVYLSQPLFWFGYVVVICLSPWHGVLFRLLMGFLLWIWHILRGIPVFIITCIVQNHQQDETATGPPRVVGDDDIGGNPILLEQPTSEPNTVLVAEPRDTEVFV
ncbi:hypothetical protein RHSIM_Rhsim09G0105700 [Rhododendron simsii]|uniref:Transmembrane protein n=1 Tax=Rhododendron simsii TaxID=118357 RepID=A0A834LGK8_RHOSS|nr:hypothetical protein RHSIM_Rhsim09G0105700 [Rhododendron simsii]